MDKEKTKTGLVMKYFVLKPKGDNKFAEASREAMKKYAEVIEETNLQLGVELRNWAGQEQLNVDKNKLDEAENGG